jgi:hypothetical protein
MLPRSRSIRLRPIPPQLSAFELAVLAALLTAPARSGGAKEPQAGTAGTPPPTPGGEPTALADPAGAPPAFDPSRSDPRAIGIADQVMEALGGQEAWDRTHFLRFTFNVYRGDTLLASRSHTWDKWSGWHRLEGKSRTGEDFVVVHNLVTREGMARVGGKETKGEGAARFEQSAFGSWVNDTYWLLMPYKLKDPGVILSYAGEVKEAGATYDRIAVSFDNVGLTPKDRYWAYVNRETHLMDRWGFVLNGEDEPETVCDWKNWKRYGSILLSDEKPIRGADQRIQFADLEVLESLPETVFSSTAPVDR